ncbi:rhamnulokinase [Microbacterium enclense]|uniref:Rhamnulokinase n=1 Tax=Microbacterium enclense TaxID=993073 RepID=A0A1G6JHL0_9MICO|nr:rhamnulokinase family protein [Microbacterium enclense]KSU54847.1 carbohydrate kinase [Microbacterium enclense]SDC18161.1 rhamnulokinase [Microbacterium enclense]
MTVGTVAAIDLGATSGRVMIGHVGPDTLVTEAVMRFGNNPRRIDGQLHWNTGLLYSKAILGLRTAAQQHAGIQSIGVDSWAVDYGLVSRGSLLSEPFHYRDERTAQGVERVHQILDHGALFERNGLQFLPFNTIYQLASEAPRRLEAAEHLLLIPDLFNFWLTGEVFAERTNASTTGLLDIRTGEWDLDLMASVGVPSAMLPSLVDPGMVVGTLTATAAHATGLSTTVPVTAVGSHDTASAVAAVPLTSDGAAFVSCGTWGLVGVEVGAPVLTPAALQANFTNEGGVDGRVRLLRNVMGLWVLTEAIRGWQTDGHLVDLEQLLRNAAALPERAVSHFDIDDARFLPPGDMPSRIDAWCLEHGVRPPSTRDEYARSIVESLAQAFAATAHEAAALKGTPLTTINLVGGGALNELLCQRTADRAGVPVDAGPVEATALGNLLIQARSVGLVHGSLEALRDLVLRTHSPRRYTPHI